MVGTKFKMQNSKFKIDDKQENKEEEKSEEKKENREVEELKKKTEEFDNKYKRALADYQNLEKRVREERTEWIVKSNKDLLLHLLPVLDTLILVEKHLKDKNEGLSLSIKQFLDILKDEGVIRIETEDKSFDPSLMECVETIEGEEGKVIEEVRPGYLLNEQVLRATLVKVGKKKV